MTLTYTNGTTTRLDIADEILRDLRGCTERIIAELKHPASIQEDDRHSGIVILVHPPNVTDGILLHLQAARERGRVRVSASLPWSVHAVAWHAPIPAITLAATRPARHLAAAIDRDLVPEAIAYTLRARGDYAANVAAAETTGATLTAVRVQTQESLTVMRAKEPRHVGDLRRVRFCGHYARTYIDGEIRDGLTTISLDDLNRVQLIAVLRALAETDGTVTVGETQDDDNLV